MNRRSLFRFLFGAATAAVVKLPMAAAVRVTPPTWTEPPALAPFVKAELEKIKRRSRAKFYEIALK